MLQQKPQMNLMAFSYSHLFNIPLTGVRLFTVYGPWGRPDMAVFSFVKKILSRDKLKLFNNGDMKRDFTYIDDIVGGIISLINKVPNNRQIGKFQNDSLSNVAPFRIINIGNTKKVLLLDFIKSLEKEIGIKAKKKFLPMQKGDVHSTLSDTKLLQQITGYKTKTDYKLGIRKFVKWFKEFYC